MGMMGMGEVLQVVQGFEKINRREWRMGMQMMRISLEGNNKTTLCLGH
jgi:hypothetical protein